MDIVERLRSWVLPTLYDDTLDVMNEAADEIERLRREEDRLDDKAADEIKRWRERVAVLEATLEGALDSCKIWERILTKALGEKE